MDDLRVGVVVPMVGEASILFEMRAFRDRRKICRWEVHERREVFGGTLGDSTARSVLLGVSIGGIGMANAAMSTSALIQYWRPDIVVLVGCAGAVSPDFLPGDVAIGRDLCYYASYLTLPDGSVNLISPGFASIQTIFPDPGPVSVRRSRREEEVPSQRSRARESRTRSCEGLSGSAW